VVEQLLDELGHRLAGVHIDQRRRDDFQGRGAGLVDVVVVLAQGLDERRGPVVRERSALPISCLSALGIERCS